MKETREIKGDYEKLLGDKEYMKMCKRNHDILHENTLEELLAKT